MRIPTSDLLIILAVVSAIAIGLTMLNHELSKYIYIPRCSDVGYCPPSR